MSEKFRGELPQEYKMQGESAEFSEQQEIVIAEFKEALEKYQQAKERLENYGVRFTPDKGFEPVSFTEAIETDRQEEIRKEEERIKSELPEGYALKIEPYAPFGEREEGCSIIYISNNGGKTFENYGTTSNTADTLYHLKKINKADVVEYLEMLENARNKAS